MTEQYKMIVCEGCEEEKVVSRDDYQSCQGLCESCRRIDLGMVEQLNKQQFVSKVMEEVISIPDSAGQVEVLVGMVYELTKQIFPQNAQVTRVTDQLTSQ